MIELCTLKTKVSTLWMTLRAKDLVHILPTPWLSRTIQRAAWWVLVRLGAQFDRPIEKTDISTVRIDEESLLQKLRLSKRDLRHIWNQEAKYVVVGHKTAYSLMGEVASRTYVSFNTPFRMGFDGVTKVMGLTVVVVPWLEEGVLVLPELKPQATPTQNGFGLEVSQ